MDKQLKEEILRSLYIGLDAQLNISRNVFNLPDYKEPKSVKEIRATIAKVEAIEVTDD